MKPMKTSCFHYLLLIYCFILDMTNNRFDMRTRFPLKQYFFLITVSVRHLHLKDQSDWNFEHHPGQLQWHIRRILGKVDLVHQYFTKIHLHHLISWIVIFRRSHARWTWRPFQLQEIFLPDDLLMPELFVSFLLQMFIIVRCPASPGSRQSVSSASGTWPPSLRRGWQRPQWGRLE